MEIDSEMHFRPKYSLIVILSAHSDGLVQECSISIAKALEILQSCI